jgi:hypothetical protein
MTVSAAKPHPGAPGMAGASEGFSPTRMMELELIEPLPTVRYEGLKRRQRLSMLGPRALSAKGKQAGPCCRCGDIAGPSGYLG